MIEEQSLFRAAIDTDRYFDAFFNLTIAYKIEMLTCFFFNFPVIDSISFIIIRMKIELKHCS